MLRVRLTARCYPTENRDKVANAIRNIFPDAVLEGEDPVVGRSFSVEAFGEMLRKQRIRDAARAVLRRGIEGRATSFVINKQVAAVGKVSFSEGSHALGDIEVVIESDNVEGIIDKVAPNTRKGIER